MINGIRRELGASGCRKFGRKVKCKAHLIGHSNLYSKLANLDFASRTGLLLVEQLSPLIRPSPDSA